MDRAEYERRFRALFAEFVAQGLAPNDAATRALEVLTTIATTAAADGDGPATVTTTTTTTMPHVEPVDQAMEEPPAAHGPHEHVVQVAPRADAADDGGPSGSRDVDMAPEPPRDTIHIDPAPMTVNSVIVSPPPAPVRAPGSASTSATPIETPTAAKAVIEQVAQAGEELKLALCEAGSTDDYRQVKRLLYMLFSDVHALNGAFVEAPTTVTPVTDADEWWGIDRELLQEVYGLIIDALGRATDRSALQNTWRNALEMMVTLPWNICTTWTRPEQLRFLLILFEHPLLFDPDYVNVTGGLCKLFHHLSDAAKEIVRFQWSTFFSNDELYRLLQILQQEITVCLYGSKKMDLVYAACAVLKELHTINSSREVPFATYDEFYNDAVNSEVDIVHDYARSLFFLKKRHDAAGDQSHPIPHRMLSELSFCDYPFVLDAASKSRVLQIDSDLEQRSRLQDAMMSRLVMGSVTPYLVLRVRRDNIIEDALQQLVRASPETLKKPLKVKFVGEEGIDEGGVRKEFFQILLRQLLDPAFGMFTYDEDTRMMWFNSDSLEATMEYELIGILLGLAIYNSVILDLHFPHIVYKKLMQAPVGLSDVETAMPSLGKGLRQLLEFEGNVEEVFQRNFEYSYEVFGAVKTVELKPGGENIAVTKANREEYVSLYVDYILNGSVARQYNAFHKGFHLVCNGEVLQMFRWEELHLLVCGSAELDFEALEQAAHYEDGFTEDSECIKNFWSVVHEFTLEEKKKLLMFATGSDRVPIRGLSNLIFVISRNGPDSERLPTAHTCFNHLLLPEYSTRDKLKERLLLAINQAEGFGLR